MLKIFLVTLFFVQAAWAQSPLAINRHWFLKSDGLTASDTIKLSILDQRDPGGWTADEMYQIGFHPVDSFSVERYHRIVDTLKYVEGHSHTQDRGPVRYVTAKELTSVGLFSL